MFLSVYTPTYMRPGLLAECVASVQAQTVPVDHVIVHDEVGLGIDGMYADIPNHAHKVSGEYVMVLSDDNVLGDPYFAVDLERHVYELDEQPDVIVWRGDLCGREQPSEWGDRPKEGSIDLSCFGVRRDLWVEYADRWGHRYEGDFDFINALYVDGHRFEWWDRLAFRALRISNGAPE